MSRKWKRGDVAILPAGKIAVVDEVGNFVYGRGKYENARPFSINATKARPLVTIDPEDAKQVERLRSSLLGAADIDSSDVRDALREYADPTPPKPEELREPTEMTAVVAEASGRYWVRVAPAMDGSFRPWHSGRDRSDWSDIDAVRVLSHGVTEGEA